MRTYTPAFRPSHLHTYVLTLTTRWHFAFTGNSVAFENDVFEMPATPRNDTTRDCVVFNTQDFSVSLCESFLLSLQGTKGSCSAIL